MKPPEEFYNKKSEALLKHVRGEMEKVILAKSMESITAHAKPKAMHQAEPNGRFWESEDGVELKLTRVARIAVQYLHQSVIHSLGSECWHW